VFRRDLVDLLEVSDGELKASYYELLLILQYETLKLLAAATAELTQFNQSSCHSGKSKK